MGEEECIEKAKKYFKDYKATVKDSSLEKAGLYCFMGGGKYNSIFCLIAKLSDNGRRGSKALVERYSQNVKKLEDKRDSLGEEKFKEEMDSTTRDIECWLQQAANFEKKFRAMEALLNNEDRLKTVHSFLINDPNFLRLLESYAEADAIADGINKRIIKVLLNQLGGEKCASQDTWLAAQDDEKRTLEKSGRGLCVCRPKTAPNCRKKGQE